jgi:hypothetical protein
MYGNSKPALLTSLLMEISAAVAKVGGLEKAKPSVFFVNSPVQFYGSEHIRAS